MTTLSTHVLDTATGEPASGMRVHLARSGDDGWDAMNELATDSDGRIAGFGDDRLSRLDHRHRPGEGVTSTAASPAGPAFVLRPAGTITDAKAGGGEDLRGGQQQPFPVDRRLPEGPADVTGLQKALHGVSRPFDAGGRVEIAPWVVGRTVVEGRAHD